MVLQSFSSGVVDVGGDNGISRGFAACWFCVCGLVVFAKSSSIRCKVCCDSKAGKSTFVKAKCRSVVIR